MTYSCSSCSIIYWTGITVKLKIVRRVWTRRDALSCTHLFSPPLTLLPTLTTPHTCSPTPSHLCLPSHTCSPTSPLLILAPHPPLTSAYPLALAPQPHHSSYLLPTSLLVLPSHTCSLPSPPPSLLPAPLTLALILSHLLPTHTTPHTCSPPLTLAPTLSHLFPPLPPVTLAPYPSHLLLPRHTCSPPLPLSPPSPHLTPALVAHTLSCTSMANSIDVDAWESGISDPDIHYGNGWQKSISGTQLLDWQFPKTGKKNTVSVISDKPTMTNIRIIDIDNISTLEQIPPSDTIEDALKLINSTNLKKMRKRPGTGIASEKSTVEPWGVRLGELDYMTVAGARLLAKTYSVKDFVYKLRTMQRWFDDTVKEEDANFADWFLQILNSKGIMKHQFDITADVQISMSSLLTFPGESWLDDNALLGIMAQFEKMYGDDDSNLFIPPLTLHYWHNKNADGKVDWTWKLEAIQSGRVKRVFGIIQLTRHWGAIEINFVNHTFHFGDSLNRSPPRNTLAALRRWLTSVGQTSNIWPKSFAKFDIAQQGPRSGSCGINAANGIEHAVNPTIPLWTEASSAYHRIRFLKLLTSYEQVSI